VKWRYFINNHGFLLSVESLLGRDE